MSRTISLEGSKEGNEGPRSTLKLQSIEEKERQRSRSMGGQDTHWCVYYHQPRRACVQRMKTT